LVLAIDIPETFSVVVASVLVVSVVGSSVVVVLNQHFRRQSNVINPSEFLVRTKLLVFRLAVRDLITLAFE